MVDAARAVLIASQAPVEAEVARTHNGLISAFGLHLIKTGVIARDLEDAVRMIAWTETFVETIGTIFRLRAEPTRSGLPDPPE
jgi:uncharacterized protein (UPF0332 family)